MAELIDEASEVGGDLPASPPLDAEVSTFGDENVGLDDSNAEQVASEVGGLSDSVAEPTSNVGGDARNLSVEPGGDPLLPRDVPEWILGDVHRVADVDHFPVGGIPTSQKVNVDKGLDVPMRTALAKYVAQLVGPEDFEGLSEDVTSDYIRKNLIDEPNGYIAEIATSEGPMYQKWVKLSVTPSQREQLRKWNHEELQASNLPIVVIGMVGLLGFVGLTHLVLKSWHGMPSVKPEVTVADAVGPKKSSGAIGFLVVTFMVLCIPALLFVGLFTARQATQREVMLMESAVEQEVMRAAQGAAEAQAALERSRQDIQAEVGGALQELEQARNEMLRSQENGVRASRQLQSGSGGITIEGTSTIIRGNGDQPVIIRSR